jgi:hypothetical protein
MPYLPPLEDSIDPEGKPPEMGVPGLPTLTLGNLSPQELAAELAARGQKLQTQSEAETNLARQRRRIP